MALRAFHSNPALGGFGGESNAAASSIIASEENCDAFAQVLKELVDNAVDACSKPGAASATRAKRVRVAIERVCQSDEDHEEYIDTPSLLRVTVSDNGCGMDDIQQCVNCFRSTKGTNADAKTTRAMDNSEDEEDDSDQEMTVKERESKEAQTAGRYGLGLTLCLLHAQRLVPGSCASITSATAEREHYTRANFVVDKDQDSVRCVKRERIVKTSRHESGTAVSLLLPDGPMAKMAWPRIAEYFARFQLSLQLQCSVEVLAPSLSPVPLFVRPPAQQHLLQETAEEEENKEDDKSEESLQDDLFWMHGAVDQPSEISKSHSQSNTSSSPELIKDLAHRKQIRATVQSYLKRNVELQNVAHASHPIGRRKRRGQGATPTMDVTMVVHSREQDDDDDGSRTTSSSQGDDTRRHDMNSEDMSVYNNIDRHARLSLVRMVNSVPLLDGAEAAACGLVHGISSSQAVWNSFGLQITSTSETISESSRTTANDHDVHEDDDQDSPTIQAPVRLFVPVYSVRDSDQVAPFFQRGVHDLFEDDGSHVDDTEDDESIDSEGNPNRQSRVRLLPAHIRLGEILVIVQINAEPSSLPLPTLSKESGRLPLNNGPISTALELCITDCLRSLQSTNSELLLTSHQLKHTVRDTRYIPAVSAAIASIVSNSNNTELRSSLLRSIKAWKREGTDAQDLLLDDVEESNASGDDNDSSSSSEPGRQITVSACAPAIEKRLRSVLYSHCKTKANTSRRSKENQDNVEEGSREAECDDEEEENALWRVNEASQQGETRGLPTNISEELDCDIPESEDESDLLSASGQDGHQNAGSSYSSSCSSDSHPARDQHSRGESAQEGDEDGDDEWW